MNHSKLFVNAAVLSFMVPLFGQDIPFDYSIVVPGVSSQARAIGDIDGDGKGDLVVVEGEFEPNILAWFEFPDWTRHNINKNALEALDYVADCKLADLDGDGSDRSALVSAWRLAAGEARRAPLITDQHPPESPSTFSRARGMVFPATEP